MSIDCDVVLLPDEELAARAIEASRKLAPLGTLFTLREGEFYPHVSVYMLQLKDSDLPRAKKIIAGVADQTDKFMLQAIKYYQTHNFFDCEYQKTEALSKLQNSVIGLLNPVRDGMRDKDKERMAEATGVALENFKRYVKLPFSATPCLFSCVAAAVAA